MRGPQAIAAVAGLALLIAIPLFLALQKTPPSRAPATPASREPDAPPQPFRFDRRTVAEIAAKSPPDSPPARNHRRPRVKAVPRPDDPAAARIARAEAATNAADVYRLIFAELDDEATAAALDQIWSLLDQGRGSLAESYLALTEQQNQQLRQLLQSTEIQRLLAMAAIAAEKEFIDFELDYAQGFELLLPHLSPMRQLTKLASVQVLAAADGNQPDLALAMATIGMRVARHANDDRLLITSLVEIASDRLVLESLAAAAQHPDVPPRTSLSPSP